jgi:Ca-activated chloride channel family protein
MAGRHSTQPEAAQRGKKVPLVGGAALVLVAVLVSVLFVVLSSDKPGATTAVHCKGNGTGVVKVDVQAAPAIAPTVTDVAKLWTAERHGTRDGRCVEVVVAAVPSTAAEVSLSDPGAAMPALWIPDSSVWWEQLLIDQAQQAGAGPEMSVWAPIASTPVVVATSDVVAAKLAITPSGLGWKAAIAGQLPIALPNPSASTEGLLSLLNVQTQLAGAAGNRELAGTMVRLSKSALTAPDTGFAQLVKDPAKAPIFVATEQAVLRANSDQGHAFAIYPAEGTRLLEFPPVRLWRIGDDTARIAAADEFERQLHSDAVQSMLAKAGFRNGKADPLSGVAAGQGVTPGPVSQLAQPSPQDVVELTRLWNSVSTDSHTLAVIDVSGSMNESAGGSQSKIQVASAAAGEAVSFYRGSSELGLWAFSSDQSTTAPWAELVSTGPLSGRVGSGIRAEALSHATASLAGRVHGGTALYDTTLAAYGQARRTYSATKTNSLIVITDGQNDFQGGITLEVLLAKLKSQADPNKPLPITTIGIGSGADLAALEQISGTTGGKTYVVHGASDMRDVFLDAFVQR